LNVEFEIARGRILNTVSPTASPATTPVLRLLPRLLVAAALTAYIFVKSHPSEVFAAAAAADWGLILVAVALVLADRTLMAYRWLVLLCTVETRARPPLTALMRIFFVSTFVGTFLPASVGGDAVRAYSTARLGVPGEDAVASVLMDRMLGVASIVVMAILGLTVARDLAGSRAVLIALAAAGLVCVVTVLLIFSATAATLALAFARRLPIRSVQAAANRILASIRKYESYPGPLANVLICSIAVQALRVVQAYYLGRGLGIDAGIESYFASIPIILLVMLLPVTFNGIGTSQAAFVWLFARIGVPAATSFALSVLFVALGIVGNLPGAVLFATGPRVRERQVTL
jgi:glycosyltransferase 2 family protein